MVYCGRETKNDMAGTVSLQNVEFIKGRVFDRLIMGNFIGSTSFPLMRTAYLREVGGFDPLMQSAQDCDVWLRLAEKYEISYVEDSLVIYHMHPGEQISKNYKKRIAGQERLNAKNAEYLRGNRKARWIRTMKLVPEYARDKQYGKAQRLWLQAAFTYPMCVKTNLRYLYSIWCVSIENRKKEKLKPNP